MLNRLKRSRGLIGTRHSSQKIAVSVNFVMSARNQVTDCLSIFPMRKVLSCSRPTVSFASLTCFLVEQAAIIYTCDKQVLWESAGAFFPRDSSLISRGNSHVSRVRGLVVRCLLFNPEVSCSNPWVCANFFTSIPKQKVLTFFGTMRLFGFVRLFFEIF